MTKATIAAMLALLASAASASAEQRYDRRLEAAAINIAAAKMGPLRAGFGAEERPQFVAPLDSSKPSHLSAGREDPAPSQDPATGSATSSFTYF